VSLPPPKFSRPVNKTSHVLARNRGNSRTLAPERILLVNNPVKVGVHGLDAKFAKSYEQMQASVCRLGRAKPGVTQDAAFSFSEANSDSENSHQIHTEFCLHWNTGDTIIGKTGKWLFR